MSQQPKQPRQSMEKRALEASFRDPRTLKSDPTHKIEIKQEKNPLKPTIHNSGKQASENIRNAGFYQRWKKRQDGKGGKKRRRTKKKRKRRRTKKKRKSRRRKRRRTRK